MKKYFLFFVCLLTLHISSFGAIILVNAGDDLQAKMNAAAVGDVLIVSAGTYGAGGITFNKRLTLIGTGYLFPANAPSTGVSTISGTLNFLAAADGSVFTGFNITGSLIQIGSNNITFSRNLVNCASFYLGYNSAGYANTNNVIIKQCKFTTASSVVNIYGATGSVAASNYQFLNNLFDSATINLSHASESSGVFINNSFSANLTSSANIATSSISTFTNVSFYNNIFGKTLNTTGGYLLASAAYIPTNFHFNVLVGNGVPEMNAPSATNLINQTANNIYAGWASNPQALTDDARNILKSASPALNYGRLAPYLVGSTATDAGAYGGAEPYIMSGIPIGPYAYQLTVPNVAANNSNIQITVKAKSNN